MRLDRWLMQRREVATPPGADVGGNGSAAPPSQPGGAPAPAPTDWRATLPEDLRADKTLERYKDVADLARGAINQHKALSSVVTKVPGPDAKPEEVKAFHAKLGVPEKVEGYEAAGVRLPELSTGEWDTEKLNSVAERFRQAGLTPAQYQLALDVYAEQIEGAADAQGAKMDELRTKWGMNFDPRMYRASQIALRYGPLGPEGNKAYLDSSGWGNNPFLAELLYEVSTRFREGEFVKGDFPGEASIDGELDKIEQSDAYKNPAHPGHQAALNQRLALRRQKLGADNRELFRV